MNGFSVTYLRIAGSWCRLIQDSVSLNLRGSWNCAVSIDCCTKPSRQLRLEIVLVFVFLFESHGELDELLHQYSLSSAKNCDRKVSQMIKYFPRLYNSSLCTFPCDSLHHMAPKQVVNQLTENSKSYNEGLENMYVLDRIVTVWSYTHTVLMKQINLQSFKCSTLNK